MHDQIAQVLGLLQQPFVRDAMKAALIIAIACSFLGVFVVLKRIVFVGAALAEISSLGAALAFFGPVAAVVGWVGNAVPGLHTEHSAPLFLALVAMLLAVGFFSHPRLGRRLPREAIIGTAYVGAMALTVLVLTKVPSESEHAMDMLNGNIIGVSGAQMAELFGAAAFVGVIQALFFKEFVLVSFDPEVARTLGYPSSRWELLWYLTLGIIIAVSIHVAGPVLVFAYLVVPAVTALQLSRRLSVVLVLSVLFGLVATVAGVILSVDPATDLPTGPSIVACSVAILLVVSVFKWITGSFARK